MCGFQPRYDVYVIIDTADLERHTVNLPKATGQVPVKRIKKRLREEGLPIFRAEGDMVAKASERRRHRSFSWYDAPSVVPNGRGVLQGVRSGDGVPTKTVVSSTIGRSLLVPLS